MFPDEHGNQDVHKAKTVCQHCPVIVECRHNAIGNDEEFGIWGGLTRRERNLVAEHQTEVRTCRRCGVPYVSVDNSFRGRKYCSCLLYTSDAADE